MEGLWIYRRREEESETGERKGRKRGLALLQSLPICCSSPNTTMRERDRERAQARTGKGKNKDDGLTPEQRRERDAKALQEKQAKKAGQGSSGGGDTGGKTDKK
ncbi:hypothetical protein L1049_017113 [Liquidambar formosana]|uniref:Small EDRK-rich factor-like N-terminal domain-containing protein n=1 Tax=Liquidambar formosana TaxID=63359 RepID=A0AAP0X3X5_LIQFO